MVDSISQADLLQDGFSRVREIVHDAVSELSVEQLHARIGPAANPIAWLIWHLARVQDDHFAAAAGTEQVWTDGWHERFGLPFPAAEIGYGQSSAEVARVRVESADLLTGYFDAVHERTTAWLATVDGAALAEVVDENWDPPVTLAVRVVSVLSDCLQHAGQAAYVRGLL